jgi:hypothetical protein
MYCEYEYRVSIVEKKQTTNMDELQNIVTKITNDVGKKHTCLIKSNQKTKDETNSFVIQNYAVDFTDEEPYTPENIVHRMYGHSCKGLYRQIHTMEVVADMVAFNISIIAKNRTNTVIALMRTTKAEGPTCVINWHMEIVKQFRLGGSIFTDIMNTRCHRYYEHQTINKSVEQTINKSVEKKEVYRMPTPVPITKESRLQSSQSTMKRTPYVDPDYTEYGTEHMVDYSIHSKTSEKKRKTCKTTYKSGSDKKRKDV